MPELTPEEIQDLLRSEFAHGQIKVAMRELEKHPAVAAYKALRESLEFKPGE
jgi:hypothetical protein